MLFKRGACGVKLSQQSRVLETHSCLKQSHFCHLPQMATQHTKVKKKAIDVYALHFAVWSCEKTPWPKITAIVVSAAITNACCVNEHA